ncbi:proline racemase family protein [Aliikangiella marina]|uniref:proline racemase family protein n=1 Tax=Aliikangiella marina TaxID=1712262 RepID=UPI00163DCC02|nr:proline racemase family protein [Aliikangiella marina]
MTKLTIIDSHTGGEPTRTIVSGGPDLGTGSMAERKQVFAEKFDHFRRALVNEPRGSDVMVGAILCEPADSSHAAGVIFFNNVGYLNMCGHGTIGVAVTLYHLGKIDLGKHILETPVGLVEINLLEPTKVSIENVASFRTRKDVEIEVPHYGVITGDVAWGGNWFFLIKAHNQRIGLDNTTRLIDFCSQVRDTLNQQNITGDNGAEIDHIELFAEPTNESLADSQNFVLCPGREYDRSPCGTGTSAKLACLYADGHIKENEVWRQQSIIGSIFEGAVTIRDGQIVPTISGSAFVNMQAEVLFDPNDPFQFGF